MPPLPVLPPVAAVPVLPPEAGLPPLAVLPPEAGLPPLAVLPPSWLLLLVQPMASVERPQRTKAANFFMSIFFP
jgi:hypothetical protein